MARVFLIGDPVAHSLSPAIQNAAFSALGLPHRYELLPTPAAALAEAVARVRREDVLGANVTIPHKERAVRLVDVIEEAAQRIGAVNTLFKRGGALRADNTDGAGFADALAERGVDLRGRRVLLLGAGGGARACADRLLAAGARLEASDRTAGRAERLRPLRAVPWPVRSLDGYDVVVNATSLGLHGEDALPGVALPRGLTVVDIVATAEETPLLARARAAGCPVVDGSIMLLHQAARAFRLWTGLDAPLGAMRAALPRADLGRT